jgi:hypothetical protein
MAEFKSWQSYWRFAEFITTQRRFSRDVEQTEFLEAVLQTSVLRQELVEARGILWRAQRGHEMRMETGFGAGEDEEHPSPFGPERMKPLANRACEGRANPKGISYLYLATQEKTAVAEVRPWIGSYVSIAQFRLKRNVRIVNCVSKDRSTMIHNYEPEPEERERRVWQDIDHAFSRPVTSTDDTADYAPTQVLAEFFRERALDGIAYGSSLGPGHNLALFDPDAAEQLNCNLVQIKSIELEYSIAANPYVLTNPSKEDSIS